MWQAMQGQGVWVRRVEHLVLRLVSLAFSLGSAHAIRWFFAPLDGVDVLQPFITWTVAVGFGVLGYFVSRGLAHRLMNKERIRAYLPICLVVELVEIFCNYALAAAVIERARWLEATPRTQHAVLTLLTYVVLSIIPLVSLLLAVVDMDLERSKHGAEMPGGGAAAGRKAPVYAPPSVPRAGAVPTSPTVPPLAPNPTYAQGYATVPARKRDEDGVEGGKRRGVPFAPVQVQLS